MTVLSVAGLSRRYFEVLVLDDLKLELEAGDGLALLGPNGSGKTTALQCVAGLLEPSGGTVRVVGADPHREPEAARARAALAYVGDAPLFYRDLTVAEHLELVSLSHGRRGGQVTVVLEELGLTGHRDRFPQELSTGLRRRAQLACALVRPFRLLVLDEPTLGLDQSGQRVLADRLRAARDEGAAVLLSTHQTDFAAEVTDGGLMLSEGRTVGTDRW